MNQSQKLFLACGFIGAVVGIFVFAAAGALFPKSSNDVFRDFYTVETMVSVSPTDYLYGLRTGKPLGILVDLRTPEDYKAGHMVGAINIPAGQMDTAQLLAAFSKLPKNDMAALKLSVDKL